MMDRTRTLECFSFLERFSPLNFECPLLAQAV